MGFCKAMERFVITRLPAGEEKGKRRLWPGTLALLLAALLFVLGCILFAACAWIDKSFGIQFEELLYTLATPLKGSDTGLVAQCIHASGTQISLVLVYLFLLGAVLWVRRRYGIAYTPENRKPKDLVKLSRRVLIGAGAAMLVFAVIFADHTFQIREYIKVRMSPTLLYEENYVDPREVAITGEGKNLIYIYLESMETTYASQAAGGQQPADNYIPGLTQLAQDNLSFSNSERLGGFRPINGTTWTMASILATTSGVPYAFPTEGNSMGNRERFASGLTSLGEVLEEKGYQNEFLCGSDADFAGRKDYFTQHGDYKIFDLFTAREEGYIPEDYKVWWGYEDKYLYQIAKDELTELSQGGKPFNFTMLTVDTHHIGGYACSLCQEEYEVGTANVVSCADRQITEFIQWCKQQDFYKDTVIIISGDHPRMDNYLVKYVPYADRTIYNCFLNSQKQPSKTMDREFTAMDMFPTILSAMGFEIQGDRLGLGVDLFSNESTLCERLGFEGLEAETKKYSDYYVKHFA